MTLAGTTLWICSAIACAVFCVMIHSIATFRPPAGAARRGRLVEILWALVPILIIAGSAAPALRAGTTIEAQEGARLAAPGPSRKTEVGLRLEVQRSSHGSPEA